MRMSESAEADQKWLSAGLNLSNLGEGSRKVEVNYRDRLLFQNDGGLHVIHSVADEMRDELSRFVRVKLNIEVAFPVRHLHRFEGGHPLTRTTGLGEGSSPLQPPVETEAAMRRARAGVLLDSQIRREEARDEAELTLAGGRAFVRGDGSGQYGAPEPILSQQDL